jgi:diguanylate cyclase (GGDEF)-like protein/PAS domain S-box-containing protein
MTDGGKPADGGGSSTPAELLEAAFEESTIGMAVIRIEPGTGAEKIIQCNPALSRITGHPKAELLDQGLDLLALSSDSRASEAIRSTGAGGGQAEFERSLDHADGGLIWVLVTLSSIETGRGEDEYRLLQIQDISERRVYQQRLQFLAGHDPLTGLVNIRRMLEVTDQGMAYQRRYGGDVSLLNFDLDNFKAVNDSIGHAEGDQALKGFAARLTSHSRDSDTVARLGGDEFAIFLPGTGLDDAVDLGETILQNLRSKPIAMGASSSESLTLSASVGATALGGRETISAQDLATEADAALYAAKAAGRNQVVAFPIDDPKEMWEKSRLTWAERTRRALDEDNLFLDAQPIRRIATGETDFYEMLLRMRDPVAGIVMPPTFLYTAERFGLSAEIDSWVFNTSISALARATEFNSAISINVTGSSLAEASDFAREIPRTLDRASVDPSRIIFELTEQVVVSDLEQARRFIEHIHAAGCRFALDDFGAGFGGFFYLKNLPVDILKIDGEFIRSLPSSNDDQLIVRAMTEMGKGMNLEVVAEFVTDAETEALCADLGVDMAQGSNVGLPVRMEQALGLDQ